MNFKNSGQIITKTNALPDFLHNNNSISWEKLGLHENELKQPIFLEKAFQIS